MTPAIGYEYGPGGYDIAQLQAEIVAAGLPNPQGIMGSGSTGPGTHPTDIRIMYADALTALQKTQLDGVVAAHVPEGPRVPRPLYAIRADLQALSTTQFSNVWQDLSAAASPAPRKYLLDEGPNAAAIFALDWSVYTSGGTAAQVRAAQLSLTAEYVQDNPKYLVRPPFDSSINIPGDMPA